MRLQNLFEPIRVGGMRLKNRIVMPAMDTNFGTVDGFVTPRLCDYYEERAKGGVGLIVVQIASVDYPRGKATIRQISIDHDKYIRGLSQLAEAIERGGARAAIQLEHGGRITTSAITGQRPVGASPSVSQAGEPVRELTTTEIAELVERHARAAALAREAGFDGVEIHGGHGHLLAQFLCPHINQRKDQYGGSLENRARFLLEVIRACRAELGRDYPIWCRINGAEYGVEPAIDYAQAMQVACWAESAGADAISVSGYGYGVEFDVLCPGLPGFHLVGAARVKRSVRVPVIAVGRILPELGEWALREGIADMIAMGRALIADPYLPKKTAEERLEDIVPCLGCWECVQAIMDPTGPSKGNLKCSVNPTVGRERECAISLAPARKRVIVVGGGPAGMEAARVARLKGHNVALVEREGQLGGQLIPAAAAPHKEGISLLIDYYSTQLTKLGVKVELGKEATLDALADAEPDAVIWAAGATPLKPEIPGINQVKTVFATEVLSGRSVAGDTVVIIGAATVGCETASFLADRGKKVILVDVLPNVLTDMGPVVRARLLEELANKEVEVLTGVKDESFSRDGLTIRNQAGKLRTLRADTYVLAAGARSNSKPIPALKRRFQHISVVGDSIKPRHISDAIAEGFEAGQRV